MQLSFNLATGGAINGSHGPQRPICKFWCYVHAINLSVRPESSLNQFKSVPNCSEVLSGFGTGRFCAHRCFVTMSNAQKRQKRQAATNAEAAIAHQSSPRSYVLMSSLCADADADADQCGKQIRHIGQHSPTNPIHSRPTSAVRALSVAAKRGLASPSS